MKSIDINPQAEKRIRAFVDSDAHASLLTGVKGVGLATIASWFTKPVYVLGPELLTKTSTIPAIGVDQIRELYNQTRSKVQRSEFYIIDDAEMMTLPAQNSFLKLLEEPPTGARFILTSHHPDKLLVTIRSRVQQINVLSLHSKALDHMITESKVDEVKAQRLRFIAPGLPAELRRLLDDELYYRTSVAEATLAKQLVEATSYQRLILLSKNTLTRSAALSLIERMINFLSLSPTDSQIQQISALLNTHANIQANGNVKLQLAAAMVY